MVAYAGVIRGAGDRLVLAVLVVGLLAVQNPGRGGRVALSPGSVAITAAAASQPAAMMNTAVSGTVITGVMPS